MPTLLHIDSSPLYGTSISRELTAAFVTQWKAIHPDGQVLERDLNAISIPPLSAAVIAAIYTPEPQRTPEQKQALTLSDTLIGELEQADEWVIGVPMHNFSVSSALKLWIDHIVRAGRTFAYGDGTFKGLLTGKKATCIVTTGGIYDPGTQSASFNHVEPYLKSLFAFNGVTDVTFLTAGGTSSLRQGVDRTAFLAPHLQAVQNHANHAQLTQV